MSIQDSSLIFFTIVVIQCRPIRHTVYSDACSVTSLPNIERACINYNVPPKYIVSVAVLGSQVIDHHRPVVSCEIEKT